MPLEIDIFVVVFVWNGLANFARLVYKTAMITKFARNRNEAPQMIG